MLHFSLREYKERIEKIRRLMKRRKIRCLIITKPENIYYTTGYRSIGHGIAPIQCVILPEEKDPMILARMLEKDTVETQAWVKDREFYMDHQDSFEFLRKMLKGVSHLGLEMGSWYMPANTYKRIEKMVKGSLLDATGLIEEIRIAKSRQELEYMKKSATITDIGMKKGIEAAKVGMYEYELFAEIAHAMYKKGQDDAMNTYIGVNSGRTLLAHDTYKNKKIEKGDMILLELGGCYCLYTSNAIASILTEQPSSEVKEAHKVTVELHDSCRDAVQEGLKAEEIHKVADKIYRRAGYGPYYRRIGFSVGINAQPTFFIGENFDLVKGNKRVLKEGMTLSIEPGVYKPGKGGSIVGSNVIVRESRYEQLTTPFTELYEV